MDFINNITANTNPFKFNGLIILTVEIILATALFLIFYRINDFEASDD